MWFEKLTGFQEESPQQVRANISVDGTVLKSHVNGKSYICGELQVPSLAELRERVRSVGFHSGKIQVREVVADVQQLHTTESNAGALFQVASQFNLLEMISPNVTPEQGVGRYEDDPTQGPACAIAAGAGTIYRNYLALVNGQTGQSTDNQIDCLADLGKELGNDGNRLWEMRNGYAMPSHDGLAHIADRLRASGEVGRDQLRQLLRIGIQWNTQVTLNDCKHQVSQAYCSALPVAYGHFGQCRQYEQYAHHAQDEAELWEPFARLVLEASYEATICAAILNAAKNTNNRVFLTFLGGGVFGNRTEWIIDAMQRVLKLYENADLDVAIVSYGTSKPDVRRLVDAMKK